MTMDGSNVPAPDPSGHTYTRALVDQVKRGDRERFGDLFEHIAPALFSWTGLRLPESLHGISGPEDVVQEVWCRALVRFADFDPERARFRSWIFGIAKNVLMEIFKSQRGRATGSPERTASLCPVDLIPAEATAVSQQVANNLRLQEFTRRVRELDDADRELLILRGLEELPHEQIAVHLGIGEDAAQKRWVRLRDRLREQGIPEGVIEG
jgi:RNA polymerase sigma factor (sigma-70 family)